MYTEYIKYYFIFLFTIYTELRLSNKNTRSCIHHILILILTFVLTLLENATYNIIPEISHLVPTLILWLIVAYNSQNPPFAFVTVTISFGINYCIHAFSSFISTLITYFLMPYEKYFFLIISLFSCLLHAFILLSVLHIKRLRKGLPLAKTDIRINISSFLCIFFISIPAHSPSYTDPLWKRALTFLLLVFTLAFLIFWWQAQITKTYRYRLLMRELESLRTSAVEKDALIEKLYAENNRLARITHRDNSLITALKDAAIKGLRTDFENPEEMIAAREKLIANIEKLAEGRSSISPNYNEKTAREFDTGLSLLDDLLHHMDNKAIEEDIMFSVHFGIMLKDFVPQNISEGDLVHTVDDLLKNAFKSTRTCESRVVQLQFYKLGKHLVIEVADNGIPFEVRSLVNMGVEKLTTYEDGSGIGLMDIWGTKEKYRATYHLDEYAAPSPFSKKISLTFDKKNRYTIRTYRKDEILQMSRRVDLQVYDDQE